MAKTIDRRSFITGTVATGALAGVAASLAGCSSSDDTSSTDSETESSTHSWENPPDPISDDEIIETVDTDIVVVGAGVAGMAAFMYASEAGANTVIIEKLDSCSGRGLDFAAIGTKVQDEMGIEIDKGAVMNDLMKASGYKANGKLIKLWIDHSGEIFNRMIEMSEEDGVEVTMGAATQLAESTEDVDYAQDYLTRTYPTDHEFGAVVEGTTDLIGRMEKAGQEAGGESRYNTKAEQLLTDDSGAVVGVVASTDDGYVKFNTSNGVILATGDYGGNEDMVATWCPLAEKVESSCYPNPEANTGDGINMAMWIGAAIQPSDHAAMIHPIFGGGAMSTASFLKVNSNGDRFCNENTSLPGISNMYLTNGGKVWAIFDSDYESQMDSMSYLSNYNNETAGPLTQFYMDGTMDASNPGSPSDVVDLCLENGTTVEADTLEELADTIGVPSDALVATVDEYNEMVDAGVDSDFGKNAEDLTPVKQAPFYASELTAKLLVIASGLNVDGQMRVLDQEDNPISGLYAVGNVMGNFFANDYPICVPGLSHGRCVTLGALIGQAVATGEELS